MWRELYLIMDDKIKNSNSKSTKQILSAEINAGENNGQILSKDNTTANNTEQILLPQNTSIDKNISVENDNLENIEATNNDNGGGKNKRVHLNKNVKVAIGASITVILLTLIVVIVVLAVQTMNAMTQMYYTNFSYVTDYVVNNKFVAAKGNEYVLMEGDKEIAGGFRYLRLTTEYGGYYYVKENGESGLLNFDGDEIVKFPAEEKYNFKNIAEFSPETITVTEGGIYKTYKLSDFSEVTALSGISPVYNVNNSWFNYVSGSYAIFNYQADSVTATFSDGTTANFNGGAGNIALIAAGNGKFLLSNYNKHYLASGGGVVPVNDFAQLSYGGSWFYGINNSLHSQKLENLNIDVGGNIYDIGEYLQAGNNIYTIESGTLKLFKENALLSRFEKEKPTYVSGRILYDKNGKELTRAESETGAFAYTGGGFVIDGTTVRTLNSSKKIENVQTEVFGGNLEEAGGRVFLLSDGSFATLDGSVYTKEQQQSYGKVILTDGQYEIYKLIKGYIFVTEKGIYTSEGSRNFIALDTYESFYLTGDKKNAENFVVSSYNGLTFYRLNRGFEEVNRYYGENLKIKESFKSGLVVFISNENLLGNVCAIFAPNGSRITSFNYSSFKFEEMGDYILALRNDGKRVLINIDGKEVITDINDYKILNVYDYNGEFSVNTTSAYAAIMDTKGYKVLKWNV